MRPSSALSPRLACLLLGLLALPAFAADKPTVAVLYFSYDGKAPELGVLKKGLAQMLITDLSALSTVQLVERDRLQDVMEELHLGESDLFDKATVARIGQLVGARYLVMGHYFDMKDSLYMSARVIQVQTGNILGASKSQGSTDDFLALEQKLAQDITQVLEAAGSPSEGKPPSPAPARKARRLTTKTALRYSRALDAKDRKDVDTAKKELTEVIKEQPDFALASTDLALLMR